jgi:enoyl-CoA hydratase
MASQPLLLLESVAPRVKLLTLNRPHRLNALNPDLVMALHDVLDDLQFDTDTGVLVLTGAGRAFCSGADLSGEGFHREFEGSPQRAWTEIQARYTGVVLKLRRIPQIVVAAVNGPCVGGGFAIAMASDVRIASTESYFLAAQINIGQAVSEMGSSYLLQRLIGGRASEILLTGRKVQAEEAERVGLVSRLHAPAELMAAALSLATTIAEKAPLALRLSKEAINASMGAASLESAAVMEDRTQVLAVLSDDLREGQQAFMEKRKPRYKG